ncbi:hypothetical protein FOA52_010706 [Chlamydomonas sp. UWO 241]|nr:hypothetical protein FOA52_010706 [Chlamydomonas sp. UWO 241]
MRYSREFQRAWVCTWFQLQKICRWARLAALVLAGVCKKAWRSTSSSTPRLPQLEVTSAPWTVLPSRVDAFRQLANWEPTVVAASPPGSGDAAAGHDEIEPVATESHLPLVYPVMEAMPLVLSLLTAWAFPYRVLGCCVNKNARYSMHRFVTAGETLVTSVVLDPHARRTRAGHLEFDVLVSNRLAAGGGGGGGGGGGALVWSATLTLVLVGGKGGGATRRDKVQGVETREPVAPKGEAGGAGAEAEGARRAGAAGAAGGEVAGGGEGGGAAPAPAATLLHPQACTLARDAGLRYACLDGDLSPVHLWAWSARLFGLPGPVASAHLVTGCAEAALARALSNGGQLPVPSTLEAVFRAPAQLPASLVFSTTAAAACGGDGSKAGGPDHAGGGAAALLHEAASHDGLALTVLRAPGSRRAAGAAGAASGALPTDAADASTLASARARAIVDCVLRLRCPDLH